MPDMTRIIPVDDAGNLMLHESGGRKNIGVTLAVGTNLIGSAFLNSDAIAATVRGLYAAAGNLQYNGTTWERVRSNVEGELLASAARTAETNSATQTNYNHRGVLIFVDWTVEAATSTLTPKIEIQDPSSGDWIELFAAAAALTAIGKATYLIYPGAVTAGGDITEIQDLALPRTWRFTMAVGDADSSTYSVGFSMLP